MALWGAGSREKGMHNQKRIFILFYILLLIAYIGFLSLISNVSSVPFFKEFTYILVLSSFIGLLDGLKPVCIQQASIFPGENRNFLAYFVVATALALVILIVMSVVDKFVHFRSYYVLAAGGTVWLFLGCSVLMGWLEGNGYIGYSSGIRFLSWLLFFICTTVFAFLDYHESLVLLLPALYGVQFIVSLMVYKAFYVKRSVYRQAESIADVLPLIKDTLLFNLYRSFVDFSDKLYLMAVGGASFNTGYLSRQELSQKSLSAPQAVSQYLYPKLCSMSSAEERVAYWRRVSYPAFLVGAIVLTFCVAFYRPLLFYYFGSDFSQYDYLFPIFMAGLYLNFIGFFTVPLLRSYNDFASPKNAFLISTIAAVVSLLAIYMWFDYKFVWVCFLLSRVGQVFCIYKCFSLISPSKHIMNIMPCFMAVAVAIGIWIVGKMGA